MTIKMKKILVTLTCLALFLSCKNDKKESEATPEEAVQTEVKSSDELTLKGSFIYYDHAAVLQTNSEIYGVIVDSMLLQLDRQAKAFKKEPTDMVPVVVKAKLSDKKDSTEWKNKIEILKIIKVSGPKPEDNQVIKLQ